MRSKAALIFFVAALFCTLVFGFLILKENMSSPSSTAAQGESCQIAQTYHFNKDLQIKWADSKYFVSFDSADKKIQLNSWSYSNKNFKYDKISDMSLVCKTPDYNCLPAKSNFELKQFNPPYGVISLAANKGRQLLPFAWDSKTDLRLGSPLSLCGKNLSQIEKGQFFWLKDHLFFYDFKRNIIGSYDMTNLSGVSPSSAAVGPQKIMSVSPEGFLQPSSCENISTNDALDSYNILVEKNHLFIFKSNALGVFYNYEADFIPLFKTSVPVNFAAIDDDHKTIYFSNLIHLYSLNPDKLEDTVVDDKSVKMLQQVSLDSNTPVVYSAPYKKLLSFNSKKSFSGDEIRIQNLAQQNYFSLNNSFNLLHKNISYFNIGQISLEDSYYFIQRENSAAEFSAVNCH